MTCFRTLPSSSQVCLYFRWDIFIHLMSLAELHRLGFLFWIT